MVSEGALDGLILDEDGDGFLQSDELHEFADALDAAGVSSAVSAQIRQIVEDGVFDPTLIERGTPILEIVAILATVGFFLAPTGGLAASGFLVLEIGATSSLVLINLNEENYGTALIAVEGRVWSW